MKQIQKNSENSAAKPSQQPFFNKESLNGFMQADSESPFFQVQPKLTLGEPGDKYEQEADKMAEQVVQRSMEPSAIAQTQEKEEVQRSVQPLPKITPILQRSPDPIQRMEEDEQLQSVGEEPIQTNSEAPQSEKLSSVESTLNASKGNGSSLNPSTREQMEDGIGADFGDVKVHTGSDAVQMNQDLNANAFAHGNDVYFNEGKYQPDSQEGQKLIAHELTHTVQQGASVQQSTIQRATPTPTTTPAAATPTNKFEDPVIGSIDTTAKLITIPKLKVPKFKGKFGPKGEVTLPKGSTVREGGHISAWETDALSGSAFEKKFANFAEKQKSPRLVFGGTRIYYLTLKGNATGGRGGRNQSSVIMGDLPTIKKRAARPYWDGNGDYLDHQVDHKQELQLGGAETDTKNLWMLETEANRTSGGAIKLEKKRRIEAILTAAKGKLVNPPKDFKAAKANYDLKLTGGVQGSSSIGVSGRTGENWEMKEIKSGKHLKGLKFLSASKVKKLGLQGSPDELILFTRQTGGLAHRIPWAKDTTRKDGLNIFIGKNGGGATMIKSVEYNHAEGQDSFGGTGKVHVEIFPGNENARIQTLSNVSFDIAPIPGVLHGGYITRASVNAALQAVAPTATDLSPIKFDSVELNDVVGLTGLGKILPTVPFIKDVGIDLIIDGEGIRISKLFNTGDFKMPAPFSVSNSSLEIFYGTTGLGFNGEVNFGINDIGEGFLKGGASTGAGFHLEGGFNFDSELFDVAEVKASYSRAPDSAEEWAISGKLGISKNKVKGIKSASIDVNYTAGSLTAEGTADLDIPGIDQINIKVAHENNVLTVGGDFTLNSDVPGISSGSGSITVTRDAEGAYTVAASGKAVPSIPGVNAELSIEYDNGALTIEGKANYAKGMLSGELKLGITNRAASGEGGGAADGETDAATLGAAPTGEATDKFIIYGGGSLTLKLLPWLAATAGVQFLPNGEIEVHGKIGIPSTVNLFERKPYKKNLFKMPKIEIPIFAIPMGPRSIGLVAQITGGLEFNAGIGPGQLQELYAEVTYNPAKEDETQIHGKGKFVIPADAGLKLYADLGLGVSVGIASLTGGIGISGELGLKGEAAAEVDVNWSPKDGLALDAKGSIEVSPTFKFGVNAFARGELDLWLISFSKTWRKNLASVEYGSDIKFGLNFPIKYREGEAFDLSFDDLEVIYPKMDIADIATGVAKKVKDKIF